MMMLIYFFFQQLSPKPQARVVVIMGSSSDMAHCEKIKGACKGFGIPCDLRVSSAHKGTDETMKILAQYEGKVKFLSTRKGYA